MKALAMGAVTGLTLMLAIRDPYHQLAALILCVASFLQGMYFHAHD